MIQMIKGLNRVELAALVCETLKDAGIDVVLTGGSVVSIYSSEKYVSLDLDFVDISLRTKRQISMALQNIGFSNQPTNSRHFIHADTQLTIEFPSAPLTVGDEHIKENAINRLKTQQGILKLLSPTDCIKDRLAGYYYFADKQCLEQAIMVAKAQPVNLKALEQWHIREGQSEGFKMFLTRLNKSNND